MNVKELFEAGLATGRPSWTSAIPKRHLSIGGLDQFVKKNKKVLDEVYQVMSLSYRFFYDMTLDYMDEQPEEYDDHERDPTKIAYAWDEGWNNEFSIDESPEYQAAVKHLDGPDFQDVLGYMKEFIIDNARHIVDED